MAALIVVFALFTVGYILGIWIAGAVLREPQRAYEDGVPARTAPTRLAGPTNRTAEFLVELKSTECVVPALKVEPRSAWRGLPGPPQESYRLGPRPARSQGTDPCALRAALPSVPMAIFGRRSGTVEHEDRGGCPPVGTNQLGPRTMSGRQCSPPASGDLERGFAVPADAGAITLVLLSVATAVETPESAARRL